MTLPPQPLVFVGHIDGLVGRRIVGWAKWGDAVPQIGQDPIELQVLVDAEEIGIVHATIMREDVAAAVGGDGRCGFDCPLPPGFDDQRTHQIEVRSRETGAALTNSPWTFVPVEQPESVTFVTVDPCLFDMPSVFHDPVEEFERLRANTGKSRFATEIATLYPPFRYVRPAAHIVARAESAFQADLTQYFNHINIEFVDGAATHIVALQDVFVFNNRIHHIAGDQVVTVYETARPPDRPFTPQREWTASVLRRSALKTDETLPMLYVGSAGFKNYGHWLIDDLPRVSAAHQVAHHAGTSQVKIVLPGADPLLNEVKIQSIHALEQSLFAGGPLFIPNDEPVHFDHLYFVTPVSYHPHLKSPVACRYLRDRLATSRAIPVGHIPARRIYVSRREGRGRAILNETAIIRLMKSLNFITVDVEALNFIDQANAFLDADIVVGCMGAAMTSTVFCKPSSELLYLAPEGWLEPFYWDLAAVCGHHYTALYGASPDETPMPHNRNFSINELHLEAAIKDAIDRLKIAD